MGVRVGAQSAELVFFRGPGFGLRVLAATHFSGCGYGRGDRSTFWLSFDPDNWTVKYGQGCRMRDRTFLSYTFGDSGETLTSCYLTILCKSMSLCFVFNVLTGSIDVQAPRPLPSESSRASTGSSHTRPSSSSCRTTAASK